MSPEQKLTRQQRRALEREAEKLKKRDSQPNAVRKANLKVDRQAIVLEAQARGVKPSKGEEQLWAPYEKYDVEMPIPADYKEKVLEKINLTLELMKQSENPYLKEAEEYISGLSDSGLLYAEPMLEVVVPDTGGITGGMGVAAAEYKGRLACMLGVAADSLKKTPFMLALELVHESVHLEGIFGRYEQVRDIKTLDEFIADEDAFSRSSGILTEEAHAYARYSDAMIHQLGLGRFYVYDYFTQITAGYIRYGSHPDSPLWSGFLQQETLNYLE